MNAETARAQPLTAVILAGGSGTRMGGDDKGLARLNGRPMIEYVIDAIRPQVDTLLISANRNLDAYQRYGYPVLPDSAAGYLGPLAGVASGLGACRGDRLLTVPCDSPFVPPSLADRLDRALDDEQIDVSVASNGQRVQPVFAMIRRRLLPALRAYLDAGNRKAESFYTAHSMAVVDCADWPQAFININTPEDRAAAGKQLAGNRFESGANS